MTQCTRTPVLTLFARLAACVLPFAGVPAAGAGRGTGGRLCVPRLALVAFLCMSTLAGVASTTLQDALAASLCPTSEADIANAISAAGSGGTVTLSCSTPTTISFSANASGSTGRAGTGTMTLTQSVTLDASQSPQLIAFDGNKDTQLFSISSSGVTFGVNGLTLQNGQGSFGGAISNASGGTTVTVTNSTFSTNSASTDGGAIYNGAGCTGQTTCPTGTVTVTNSTFSGNSAGNSGGAIFTMPGCVEYYGTLICGTSAVTVTNSTFSGNSGYDGGAIANGDQATVTNSTFSDNWGTSGNGAGGGIYNFDYPGSGAMTHLTLSADIIANTHGDVNCGILPNTLDTDNGYNLDTDGTCTSGKPGDISANPKLNPLGAHGGPTQTMSLQSGSPAIDAVPKSSGLCPATDQRGLARPDEGESKCDIGAYENTEAISLSCPTYAGLSTAAKAVADGDTVTLACSHPETISFSPTASPGGGGTLNISQSVTLDASQSPQPIALDGNKDTQLFVVNSGVTFGVNGLTLQNGSSTNGGAIDNNGTVTVTNSTFSGNSASGTSGQGGAIDNNGTLAVTNSTFSGNSATGTNPNLNSNGGAISDGGGTVTVTNSTFSGNSAGTYGGAIFSVGSLTLGADIIANNRSSSGNCFLYGTVADTGYNLDTDGGCLNSGAGDISGHDPKLNPLANNGGPTQTMALQSGSPAIDPVPTSTGLCPATDQRGRPRPDEAEPTCDIGAFELQSITLGSCPTYPSVSSAITSVDPGGTVTLACSHPETISVSPNGSPAGGGTITIAQDVTLDASGSSGAITFDGNKDTQLFVVNSGVTFGVNGLTFQNGQGAYGGAIYNDGRLMVTNSTISGNAAPGGAGGAIFNDLDGSLTVTNSTFSGNAATGSSSAGGAIDNNSPLTVTNSTFSGNSAATGGAIDNEGSTVTLSGDIIANSPSGGNCANSGTITDSGYNLTDDGTCGLTNGANHDLVVGAGQTGLPSQLAANGGPAKTFALLPNSPAIGAGNPAVCGPSGALANLDQRGYVRHADTRKACDIGAYDTGGAITITKGWNLIGVPLASPSITTASGLVSSLTANGQLGTGSITALATYGNGAFHLYVPGYTVDQTLTASQGVFVLSKATGQWNPWTTAGATAYSSGQVQVHLQPGWNLVYTPYPYRGLNGDEINGEIGNACGLQEIATYSGGSYHVYTPPASGSTTGNPAGSALTVPATAGMWIECTQADSSWTPA